MQTPPFLSFMPPGDIADPKRPLPIAYIGGVLTVIAIYVLIMVAVVGHLGFTGISRVSDHDLSVAARHSMGSAGFLLLFMAVNIANFRLPQNTGGRAWISAATAFKLSERALI